MTRSRGFTMIEILVALSLAGILIAGAFQIHAVFNVQSIRQKQVDDMQQSLRISMQTIERTLRASGSGMMNGRMLISPGCTGAQDVFHVQFYNGPSSWPLPFNNHASQSTTGFDTTQGDSRQGAPDVLRVVTSINEGSVMASVIGTNSSTVMSPMALGGPSGLLQQNDFALFVNTQVASTKTAVGCLRQLTDASIPVSTAVGNNFQTLLNYNTTGGNACANTNADSCFPIAASTTPVRFFRYETYFRILPPLTATDTPKLSVLSVPLGTAPTSTSQWTMIADDIEDMQIALVMNDGRVCFDHDEPYPLYSTIYATAPATLPTAFTSCDPSQATAVRITLTARTNMTSPGTPAMPSQMYGYEDNQPSVASTDGRLRRSLTSEMTLRN